MGERLAQTVRKTLRARMETIDVVISVPDTSQVAALQLAQSLGVPYREGFVKNRYVGRTFIMPGQSVRRKNVRRKLNAMARPSLTVWDVRDPDDVCGICQNNFDGVCGSCKTPRGGDECPLLFGECSHVFHMHCILKWLEGDDHRLCPMCKRKWSAATASSYQADLDAAKDAQELREQHMQRLQQ